MQKNTHEYLTRRAQIIEERREIRRLQQDTVMEEAPVEPTAEDTVSNPVVRRTGEAPSSRAIVERQRRASLNTAIDELRTLIPAAGRSTQEVVVGAINAIRQSTRRAEEAVQRHQNALAELERRYRNEMARLERRLQAQTDEMRRNQEETERTRRGSGGSSTSQKFKDLFKIKKKNRINKK